MHPRYARERFVKRTLAASLGNRSISAKIIHICGCEHVLKQRYSLENYTCFMFADRLIDLFYVHI